MTIVACGLALPLRARIQGSLEDARLESVAPDALLARLQESRCDAVILDESVASSSFLERVAGAFTGPILYCALHHHGTKGLQKIRRQHVGHIYQHPLDAREMAEGLSALLGLRLRQRDHEKEPSPLWSEWRRRLLHNLELLREALEKDTQSIQVEVAWRFAHQLAGSLGTFGLQRGGLLAREAETILRAGLDGQPLEQARLLALVRSLRHIVQDHHVGDGPGTWLQGTIVVYSQDPNLNAELSLEAMSLHWGTALCANKEELYDALGEPVGGIILDCQKADCSPESLQELCETQSCVLLDAPAGCPLPAVHLHRPVSAYVLLQAVLPHVPHADSRPQTVLVLDDDPIILKVISACLTGADKIVECLSDPLRFWDVLEALQPDLIILDVDLPPLGGIELCRALRADPQHAARPVVFVSSYNDADTVHRAFAAGADDYLFKPLRVDDLLTRVENRLQRTRQIASQAGLQLETSRSPGNRTVAS